MNKRPIILGAGLIAVALLALSLPQQETPFHNPKTGRIHGDYTYIVVYRPNDTVTGTMQYRLVAGTGSPSKAVVAPVGSMGVLGICMWNCGTSGDAAIARLGDALCEFDGPTDARNLVVPSTTEAGKCHDLGVDVQDDPWPTTDRIVGVVSSTNAGPGTYALAVYPNGTRGHFEGLAAKVTLDFPNTAAFSCQELTATVAGAVEGQAAIPSAPSAAFGADSQYSARVSAANTVSIRHCVLNNAFNPPSATFKIQVFKP